MFKKNTTDKGIELIYEIDENEKLDNVSIGMMKNNDIEALFPVDMITNDTKTQLKYQVGKSKSLNEYITEELTKEELLAVFENICKGMSCIEEYMLLEDQVILENDYIFVEGNNIRLILLPVYNRRNNVSINAFFKNLLLDMMVNNEKAAYFASDITKQLSQEESFSYDNFLNMLDALKQKRYIEKPIIRKDKRSDEFTEKKGLADRKVYNIEENISKPLQPRQYQANTNFENNDNSYKNISIPNVAVQAASFDKQPQKVEKKKGLFGLGKQKEAQASNESGFERSNNNNLLIPGREEPLNVGSQNHCLAKRRRRKIIRLRV